MLYIRIDDGFPEHPKALDLTPPAGWLWFTALCYAHRARTDGHIPPGFVGPKRGKLAAELVTARLWVEAPEGGWLIHAYLDWYPSRAELEHRDKARHEAARKAARARWNHDADDMPE